MFAPQISFFFSSIFCFVYWIYHLLSIHIHFSCFVDTIIGWNALLTWWWVNEWFNPNIEAIFFLLFFCSNIYEWRKGNVWVLFLAIFYSSFFFFYYFARILWINIFLCIQNEVFELYLTPWWKFPVEYWFLWVRILLKNAFPPSQEFLLCLTALLRTVFLLLS